MKKLAIITLFFASLMITACSSEKANFTLADDTVVTLSIDHDQYKEGQKVWLIRSYAPASLTGWSILNSFTSGQIGFDPTQDTTFTFTSQGGDYQRRIAQGTITKKFN